MIEVDRIKASLSDFDVNITFANASYDDSGQNRIGNVSNRRMLLKATRTKIELWLKKIIVTSEDFFSC